MFHTATKSKVFLRISLQSSLGECFLKKKYFSLLICFMACTAAHSQNCNPATAYDSLDINNVRARIDNGGDLWRYNQYIVPKSGSGSSLFAGALWIGGLDVQGNLHVAAQTYRQNGNDFFPGPLDSSGNVTQQTCDDFDRIWKVNKSTVDSFVAGLFTGTPSSIKEWPGRGNPNLSFLPDQQLAPFVDANGDGNYNPASGDYPAIPGDQALWFVFNDAGNIHGETGGLPLGVEVQCLAYAVKDSSLCTYSTTFYHYLIINKSQNNYDSVFIGFWSDPSSGASIADYIGSDSANQLGVIYYADEVDTGPVSAIQILKGPTDDAGTVHYLDHSMMYTNDFSIVGNPENAQHYYQYLQSIWKDGTHLTYGDEGFSNSNYVFSSDPSDLNGWSMCTDSLPPADDRMINSSGPVAIHSGQTKTFDIAVLWDDKSVYPCPSFSVIDSVANCVKNYFDNIAFISGTENISSQQQHLNVFPNPASASSIINFSGKNISRVEIFDLAGKKLFDSEAGKNDAIKLNGDQLGKGLFIYRITLRDHSSQSGKIVVQ